MQQVAIERGSSVIHSLLTVALTLLLGCGNPFLEGSTPGNDAPDELYRQRILGSDKVLYDFTFGGPAWSNDYTGITIMDSSELPTRNRIEQLLASHFSSPPSGHVLKMIDVVHHRTNETDTLQTPHETFSVVVGGIRCDVEKYNTTYGSATFDTGLMRFEFDSIIDFGDSLEFTGVSKRFGGHALSETVMIEKGNVWVSDSSDLRIRLIRVDRFINKRGNVYFPSSPFEIVPDRPIVGIATYEFIPRSTILSSNISDYGAWKKVR